jgi:phosphatidylinositol kinase/protein kinase (PI-3  family)
MVDAMGLSGVEGPFHDCTCFNGILMHCLGVYRRTCEVVLKVVRHNKDALMTILETFLHDPLFEWSRKRVSFGDF